jgi:hypothetical protein
LPNTTFRIKPWGTLPKRGLGTKEPVCGGALGRFKTVILFDAAGRHRRTGDVVHLYRDRVRIVKRCKRGQIGVVLCASMAPRPTGSFKLEREIVAVLSVESQALLAPSNADQICDVVTEMPVGSGNVRIPDVLLIYTDSRGPERSAPTPLSYYDAEIISRLARSSASLTDLAAEFFANQDELSGRLRRLEGRGLIRRSFDTALYQTTALFPRNIRIVAIEAKLKRWRDAIRQASRYVEFANEAFIAMPSGVAMRSQVVEACAEAGVGVLAVDQTMVTVVLQPESVTPCSGEWVRVVSATVGVQGPSTAARASSQAR